VRAGAGRGNSKNININIGKILLKNITLFQRRFTLNVISKNFRTIQYLKFTLL